MNESETDKKTTNKCLQCGAAQPKGMLEGLCPACLLKQGAETGPPPGSVPFQPPALEEVARLFPQLEILSFIGKGGMGAVYQARQPGLDRMVALKILPPQATGTPGFAERFNREARALARLTHPNIVAVHEFGQAGGSPFFIMEFVNGLTLRQLEKTGRLAPAEALRIVPHICEALQFAHDEGIVHRDIKPENILIDKKGRVKIADFGIAKIIGGGEAGEAVTDTRQAIGTPHYMAPEQMEKPQTVDHRAHIFSLGVVFYEMLTGQLPLGRFAPPSRKVEIDARLDEIVLRALEREPELRYQQVGEVKTQIDTIASTAPGKVPFPGVPVANRQAFALLALAFLIVGSLGGPFLLAIHAEADAVMAVSGLGLVLGLIFGVVSWRERLGRVITVAALGLVVLAMIGVLSCVMVFKLRNPPLMVESRAGRAQMAARIPGASAETWSPNLAPGVKPDLQGIMGEAKNLMNQGRYNEALGRQIWFFNHAQQIDPAYAAVRLSFALSDWRELARRYPKALQALAEIRDRDTAEFAAGHGYAQLFQEALSINGELDDPDASRKLCKIVADKDPRLARQLYYFAAGPLVQQGEYDLCSRFMGDPQGRFKFAQSMKSFKFAQPVKSQDDNFVGQIRMIVEILVGTGRKAEAENISAQATALLDDPRLHSAVTDAETRIAELHTKAAAPQGHFTTNK